jgi:hypothetical protein
MPLTFHNQNMPAGLLDFYLKHSIVLLLALGVHASTTELLARVESAISVSTGTETELELRRLLSELLSCVKPILL